MSLECLDQPPAALQWVAPAQADAVRRDAIAIATFAVNAAHIWDVTQKRTIQVPRYGRPGALVDARENC